MTPIRTETDLVERISHNGQQLVCVIRAELRPQATRFITEDDLTQQVGFVVYPKGGEIARHSHLPIERRIVGTSEVLIVRKGRCEIDVYTEDGVHVGMRELRTGDIVLISAGGHGFRMLEDTILLEIKQGPYTGLAEKEYF
jgi:uncharacterized protein YjlB